MDHDGEVHFKGNVSFPNQSDTNINGGIFTELKVRKILTKFLISIEVI